MALCLLWAAVITFAHHREMDPDGFSYLQMADHAAHGDISAFANAYWSPGYPALLAVLLALFRPAAENAFAVAHLLNYLLFAFAIASFVFFLRAWSKVAGIGWDLLVPCGFVLFLKFGIDWLGIHSCTPDLAVGSIVLLAAGIVAGVAGGSSQWKLLPLLGIVLAIGYYLKAVVFPMAILLFVVLLLLPSAVRIARLPLFCGLVIFVVCSLPLIALQTRLAGHVTFGETGRLNYAWFVNGVEGVQRVSLDPRVHLEHPARLIFESPATLAFATPVNATYPLWYDPFYWSKGVRASFNLKEQLAALKVTLAEYANMALDLSVLIAAAILLLSTASAGILPACLDFMWLLIWPISCWALYALVHTENRFLGGSMIVFWTVILSLGLRWTTIVSRGAILALVGLSLLIPTTFRLALAAGRSIQTLSRPGPTSDMVTAQALRAAGLRDGDRIAVVGATFEPYYAWIAHLKVAAQVVDQDALARLSSAAFQSWLAAVKQTGVKALVTMDRPAYENQIAWHDLPAMRQSAAPRLTRPDHTTFRFTF